MTSLCGVVSSTTCLTGWEDRFWSSVSLIIYIVSFGIVCNFVVGVRVRLGTSIVVTGTFLYYFVFFLSLV